ncbi:eukaryotic translation initiation factor 2B [Striga asiatica]|uniref:Eukaryotic translation initiation factor 2B n=1 Tax=Striga asiatica TaxID=4170 RepID=A0A5A7Q6G5_STRAF|nr:eukaryotic translation initiation factor 2B [Striga asiatica]
MPPEAAAAHQKLHQKDKLDQIINKVPQPPPVASDLTQRRPRHRPIPPPVTVRTPPAVVAFHLPPVVRHNTLRRRTRGSPDETTTWPPMNACCSGVRPLALWSPELGHPGDEVVVEIECGR